MHRFLTLCLSKVWWRCNKIIYRQATPGKIQPPTLLYTIFDRKGTPFLGGGGGALLIGRYREYPGV